MTTSHKLLLFIFLITFFYTTSYAQVDYTESMYSLIPSVTNVKMPISSGDMGYDGLNITLFKNGVAIYDQANVKYDWIISDPSVLAINTWTSEGMCKGEPCTTYSVKLKGLKSGNTGIYVVAYIDGVKSATTTINVEVEDVWKVYLKKGKRSLLVGETGEYEVGIKKQITQTINPDLRSGTFGRK